MGNDNYYGWWVASLCCAAAGSAHGMLFCVKGLASMVCRTGPSIYNDPFFVPASPVCNVITMVLCPVLVVLLVALQKKFRGLSTRIQAMSLIVLLLSVLYCIASYSINAELYLRSVNQL